MADERNMVPTDNGDVSDNAGDITSTPTAAGANTSTPAPTTAAGANAPENTPTSTAAGANAPENTPISTYAAFVSYRHVERDTAVAKEVQRFLESFTVPRALRAEDAGAHLGTVFRDEDELAASARLSDKIQDALLRSRFLIVICSPDTPHSAWVNREIEFFTAAHGRDHVLCVLADGKPSESFPPALGELGEPNEPSEPNNPNEFEPLAADLRSQKSGNKRRVELLRLAAAIIGCSLDDLLHRSRKRRRRNIAVGICAAVVVVAVIGGIIGVSQVRVEQSDRENQTSQSVQLAADAQTLLAQGDRLGALQAAMSVLPASEDDSTRPLIASARAALTEALGVYPRNGGWWQPCYMLEGKQDTDNLAVPETGDWFALCETGKSIDIYDIVTGGILFSLAPPSEATGDFDGFMEAAGHYLACSVQGNVLACFDAQAGNLLWSKQDYYPTYFVFSDDTAQLGVLGVSGTDERSFTVFDSYTGEVLKSYPLDVAFSGDHLAAFDEETTRALIAVDNSLYLIDLQTDEVRQTTIDQERVTSAYLLSDSFVIMESDKPTTSDVGSAGNDSSEVSTYPTNAHLEALRWDTLDSLWGCDFSWDPYEEGISTPFNTDPVIRKSIKGADYASRGLVVTTGQYVTVINTDDGSVINEFDLESPIVGCYAVENEQSGTVFAVTFEGKCYVMSTFEDSSEAIYIDGAEFPERIWYAGITTGSTMYFVGASAENLDKLFVYRGDLVPSYYEGTFIDDGFFGGISVNCVDTQAAWLREDGCIVVFDAATQTVERVINLADIGVTLSSSGNVSLAFSSDEPDTLYLRDSGSGATEPHIWRIDAAQGTLEATWNWEFAAEFTNAGFDISFDSCTISQEHAGTFTVSIPDYTYIGVIDAATFETANEFMPTEEVPLQDAMMLADNKMLMRFEDNIVALYDATTLDKIGHIDDFTVPDSLGLNVIAAQSGDGQHMVLACADDRLRSFDCETGALLWDVSFNSGDLYCFLEYTPNNEYVFVQDSSQACALLDAETGKTLIDAGNVDGSIVNVTFASESNKAFASVIDVASGLNSGIAVIDLPASAVGTSSQDASNAESSENSQSALWGVECVIPDGVYALDCVNEPFQEDETEDEAVGSASPQVLIVYAGAVYCVPYHSFDELIGLAQTIVSAGKNNSQ